MIEVKQLVLDMIYENDVHLEKARFLIGGIKEDWAEDYQGISKFYHKIEVWEIDKVKSSMNLSVLRYTY